MMTIVNERFARSHGSCTAEIDHLDPFSEGADMLLRAMKDEFDAPVAAAGTERSATLSARRAMAAEPDVSALRDYLQAAAARFGYPLVSTVVCIKPSGRPAFAA